MAKRRILTIDDEPDFNSFVARVADAMGLETEATTRSQDFKAAYNRLKPDIVLLDIMMPDTDGIELIQWLIGRGFDARVIVASGASPLYIDIAATISQQRGQFALTTLRKPVKAEDLRAALE